MKLRFNGLLNTPPVTMLASLFCTHLLAASCCIVTVWLVKIAFLSTPSIPLIFTSFTVYIFYSHNRTCLEAKRKDTTISYLAWHRSILVGRLNFWIQS